MQVKYNDNKLTSNSNFQKQQDPFQEVSCGQELRGPFRRFQADTKFVFAGEEPTKALPNNFFG